MRELCKTSEGICVSLHEGVLRGEQAESRYGMASVRLEKQKPERKLQQKMSRGVAEMALLSVEWMR